MCIGTSRAKAVYWLIACLAFCQCSAIELPKTTAQEKAAQENAAQENTAQEDAFDITPYVKEASDYHFRLKEAKDTKDFELRGKPIMIWSNPAKFDQKGCVLAWMHDGRPQVIGTLYSSVHNDGTRRAFEVHSLSRQAIEGRYKETTFWAPTAGVQFESLESTTPGPTVQRRMLQMRQMSREFSVELVDQGDNHQTLRLLPTPVITYEPNSAECVDGAVFAFAATGTDPDSFLIIETVKQSERLSFQYAFARFHFRELTATRNNQVVWHVDGNDAMLNNFRGSPRYRSSPYNFFRLQ